MCFFTVKNDCNTGEGSFQTSLWFTQPSPQCRKHSVIPSSISGRRRDQRRRFPHRHVCSTPSGNFSVNPQRGAIEIVLSHSIHQFSQKEDGRSEPSFGPRLRFFLTSPTGCLMSIPTGNHILRGIGTQHCKRLHPPQYQLLTFLRIVFNNSNSTHSGNPTPVPTGVFRAADWFSVPSRCYFQGNFSYSGI